MKMIIFKLKICLLDYFLTMTTTISFQLIANEDKGKIMSMGVTYGYDPVYYISKSNVTTA